jgi:hypothetical protein
MNVARTLLAVLSVALAASYGTAKFGQQQAVQDRQAEVAAQILASSGVPGGLSVEAGGCGKGSVIIFVLPGEKAGAATKQIAATLDGVTSGDSTAGFSVWMGIRRIPQFLNTQIPATMLKFRAYNFMSIEPLLRLPAVQTSLQQMHLNQALFSGSIMSTPADEGLKQLQIKSGTLASALNQIAASEGHGVWRYDEDQCGSKTFRLRWVVL